MRVLVWAVGCVALWFGGVWLLTQPQTWHTLAVVSKTISYGAWAAFEITKLRMSQRHERAGDARRWSTKPLPSGDDVLDAVRLFLKEQRKGGS